MKLFRKIVNVGNGLEIELPLIRSFIPQPPILYILHISFSLFILIYSREKNSNHTHLELLSLWCLISCESGNYLKVIRSINKWKVLLFKLYWKPDLWNYNFGIFRIQYLWIPWRNSKYQSYFKIPDPLCMSTCST